VAGSWTVGETLDVDVVVEYEGLGCRKVVGYYNIGVEVDYCIEVETEIESRDQAVVGPDGKPLQTSLV
jgi:hypothetical protein